MQTKANCKIVEFGSDLQVESIQLRRKVLRIPLGLDFDETDLLSENNQFHFVAIIDDKVAGVLILKVDNEDKSVLRMRQVAVDPEFQSQGIGTQLVRFSETWALDNKYSKIVLHARKPAVKFYLDMDYFKFGDEFLEVGIPHLAMSKRLS